LIELGLNSNCQKRSLSLRALLNAALVLSASLFSSVLHARVTDYFTKMNSVKVPEDCGGEGNQIVNGQLIGSDCQNVEIYCEFGVGNRNNCLEPCVDASGGNQYTFGQIVKLPSPRICKWGKYAGHTITHVRIADVGIGVEGSSIDVFQGLCAYTKREECVQYASSHAKAHYAGLSPKGPSGYRFTRDARLLNGRFSNQTAGVPPNPPAALANGNSSR
jgi:hypothetical protein